MNRENSRLIQIIHFEWGVINVDILNKSKTLGQKHSFKIVTPHLMDLKALLLEWNR